MPDKVLRMVLIMGLSFGAWYLLCSAVSADGHICAEMVIIRYLLNVSMVHIMDNNASERNAAARSVCGGPL